MSKLWWLELLPFAHHCSIANTLLLRDRVNLSSTTCTFLYILYPSAQKKKNPPHLTFYVTFKDVEKSWSSSASLSFFFFFRSPCFFLLHAKSSKWETIWLECKDVLTRTHILQMPSRGCPHLPAYIFMRSNWYFGLRDLHQQEDILRQWQISTCPRSCTLGHRHPLLSLHESPPKKKKEKKGLVQGHLLVPDAPQSDKSASLCTFCIIPSTSGLNDLRDRHEYQCHACPSESVQFALMHVAGSAVLKARPGSRRRGKQRQGIAGRGIYVTL